MALIRWEPYREVESLQRQMNHLFDSLTTADNGGATGTAFMPAAELHENPDAIQLRLEVPGMEAKDIDVQVTAQAIAITGERKSETKTQEKGRNLFHYPLPLPLPLPLRYVSQRVPLRALSASDSVTDADSKRLGAG